MDRGMVLYLSLDHCHPAEWSKLYLGMVKARPEKDGDIRKIVKISSMKVKAPAISPRLAFNRNLNNIRFNPEF